MHARGPNASEGGPPCSFINKVDATFVFIQHLAPLGISEVSRRMSHGINETTLPPPLSRFSLPPSSCGMKLLPGDPPRRLQGHGCWPRSRPLPQPQHMPGPPLVRPLSRFGVFPPAPVKTATEIQGATARERSTRKVSMHSISPDMCGMAQAVSPLKRSKHTWSAYLSRILLKA